MSGRHWTAQEAARLGKRIYELEIRDGVEYDLMSENKALVVDVSTGGYVIADNPLNAFARGRERDSNGAKLGYPTHYVVDGGKARVILDVLVTPAEVTENLPMLDLLFRSRFRWRLRPRSVTADAAYGTTQNIAAVEKAGICASLAVVDHEKRTSSLFGRDAFTYDAQKDLYTCPKGEILLR